MGATFVYPLEFLDYDDVRAVQVITQSVVGQARSPFTLQSYKQVQHGQIWAFNVTIRMLDRAKAQEWQGWFASLNGREGTFRFTDPSYRPRGSNQGGGRVNGAGQTGQILNCNSWTANALGVLYPGDFVRIGSSSNALLYQVAGNTIIDADANGEAIIDIWPRLRKSPNDTAALSIGAWFDATPAFGVFELAQEGLTLDIDEALRAQQFTFAIIEAL